MANVAMGLLQGSGRFGPRHPSCEHHYGDRSAMAAGFESAAGCVVICAGGLLQDADGALRELFVLGPDVDHEIAVDIAEAAHGAGGNHVQDHFVGSSGFHAGGSGEDFGADFGDDGEIGGALERGIAVAGKCDGTGSATAGVLDGGDGEGSASAGGDSDYRVLLAGFALLHFRDGRGGVVFAGFGGVAESLGASGHDVLHGAGIGVEGGRNFGGVEGAKTSAGAGADVDEMAALPETGGDYVDGAGDLRQSTPDSGGDGGILAVHEADEFQRRFAVEVGGSRVGFFSREDAEIRLWLAGAGQLLGLSFNWEVGRYG